MAVSDEVRVGAAGSHDRKRTQGDIKLVLAIIAILDLVAILVAEILAWDLRVGFDVWFDTPLGGQQAINDAIPWLTLGWMVSLAAQGAYSSRYFGAGPDEYRAVGVATADHGRRRRLGLLPAPAAALARLHRLRLPGRAAAAAARAVRRAQGGAPDAQRSGRLLHRVIAIGGPSGISEVVDSLSRARYIGYEVVGACIPPGIAHEPERFAVPVLGTVFDTRRMCNEVGADTVLVARGGYDSSHEMRRIAWDLEGSGIDLIVVPSVTDVAGPRIHMRPVAGLPLLHMEQPQAGEAGGLSKRAFDVVLTLFGLLLLSPVLLVTAAVVKLQDGGPVFFRQSRVGRDGDAFGMFKFRSMVVDAEQRLSELRGANEMDSVLFKMKDDPRITKVGKFLRRYSVDELPQLFNVLRGEMSLVGPRPPLPSEVSQYHDDVHRRLLVRPGLTGLWQVSGRSGLSWDEAVRLDLYYVDNWSMTSDLVILFKTVRP